MGLEEDGSQLMTVANVQLQDLPKDLMTCSHVLHIYIYDEYPYIGGVSKVSWGEVIFYEYQVEVSGFRLSAKPRETLRYFPHSFTVFGKPNPSRHSSLLRPNYVL